MTTHILIDAIISKFASAGLASTITGGIRFRRAASTTVLPYLVVDIIGAPLVDAYANAITADVTVQMTLFGNGLKATGTLMATVLTAYDNTTLSLSGGTHIGMWRNNEPFPLPQDDPVLRDDALKDVWGWYAEYVYNVQ